MSKGYKHDWIDTFIADSMEAIGLLRGQRDLLAEAVDLLTSTLQAGGKVLTAGNGGSAAEAMHMSEELVGRYRGNRRSLPAVALTADGTALTCIGNDFGFDNVFSRQVEGLGIPGDLLVLFSTSGNAPNLARAVAAARGRGMKIMLILGRDGGPLAGQGDCEILVQGAGTGRIQEAQQLILHILLEGVERCFPAPSPQDTGHAS